MMKKSPVEGAQPAVEGTPCVPRFQSTGTRSASVTFPTWPQPYPQVTLRISRGPQANRNTRPLDRDDLLTTASHEIRTPMYGLLGMLDLTLATELTATQRHYMTLARASAASMATLVNDLLDLSKLQSGHFTITNAECDLHRLLDESLGIFSMRAASRNIEFSLSCAADLPRIVEIDATRLLQVLSNLVGNAIKFTAKGRVRVSIAIEDVAGRSHLRLSVLDTGPGIAPPDLERIFQPFAQFHGPSSGSIPNTGLGLTITRSIVAAMGGQSSVSSKVGVGSCFEALMPTRVVATPPIQALHGATVCLDVENDVERSEYEQWLSWMGCRCVGPDSAEAVDAVVCDASRAPGLASAVPQVILMAATAAAIPANDGDPHTAEACVYKPLSPWRLSSALCEATGQARAPVAALGQNTEWSRLAGARVLLVDDDSVSALVSQSMLEMIGVQVTSAPSAKDAISALMDARFDVILTDLRLPIMDGYELSTWVRNFERQHPPEAKSIIIALSASTAPAERQRCLDVGMDDFVAKPVLREQLYAVLLKHTRQRPQAPAHFFVNTTYDLDA